MFGSLGGGEILLLILVGLIVFGPERLPTVARDAAKVLRQLRQMATSARDEITSELGPEVADLDLRSLNPRTFVQKHLLGDDEDDDPSRGLPVDRSSPSRSVQDARGQAARAGQTPGQGTVSLSKPEPGQPGAAPPYDADAT